ncbi:MAG TPA: ATP-binding protein [Candidatus Cybelea sp.]|nr:ATP-binding protein [Candidatus Cybelea sp.]
MSALEATPGAAVPPRPARRRRTGLLLRDSIALRVSLAVFGGLLLTQLVGFLLLTGERLHVLPAMDADPLAAIVDRALTSARNGTIGPDANVHARFASDFAPLGEVFDPPPIHDLRMQLMTRAGGRYDMLLVEAPFPPQAGPPPGPPAIFRLWLRLSGADATHRWLVLTVPAELLRHPDFVRLLLWWGLSLIGAVPLSLLVARRLTAPIRRFSAAAERLGLDMAASPVPERGPAELKSAAAAMNAMQRRIARFVADRTQMLAAISHDLRTPISRLRLRAEALPSGSERQHMLADLKRIEQMIAATLDFARDASAAEARCRIDLASLVESLCQEIADLGREAVYRGPSYLEFACRPIAIGRALRNILENAVEYGGGAEARIVDTGDAVEITIRDQGPGIPEAERERVFEPFYRLDRARSGRHEGAGLGLSIARNIARAHGGDVTLANGAMEIGAMRGLGVTMRLPRPKTGER